MPTIKQKGLLFILSSPSGAGKTTLSKKLLESHLDLTMSVSVTTRAKRPNEVEGIDYYFIDRDKYQDMVNQGQLLEHAKVFDHYYGTPKVPIVECMSQGHDVLFDIDWQGAAQLAASLPQDVVSVFILPPSLKELERRLNLRGQDNVQVIKNRMAKATSEISHFSEYDYVLINNNIEDCLQQIIHILKAERLKRSRQLGLWDFVKELLN